MTKTMTMSGVVPPPAASERLIPLRSSRYSWRFGLRLRPWSRGLAIGESARLRRRADLCWNLSPVGFERRLCVPFHLPHFMRSATLHVLVPYDRWLETLGIPTTGDLSDGNAITSIDRHFLYGVLLPY
jgi:hypothetical protein